jgi:hypothetical protein
MAGPIIKANVSCSTSWANARSRCATARTVLAEQLPDLLRRRRTGSFGMRFERGVVAARPTLLTRCGSRRSCTCAKALRPLKVRAVGRCNEQLGRRIMRRLGLSCVMSAILIASSSTFVSAQEQKFACGQRFNGCSKVASNPDVCKRKLAKCGSSSRLVTQSQWDSY